MKIIVLFLLVFAGCGQATPDGISVDCSTVPHCTPSFGAIDDAAQAMTQLAGTSIIAFHHKLQVTFNNGPIYWGGKFYGLTTAEPELVNVWVEYHACLFDADSALVHELLHAALYEQTGDEDNGHTRPEWKQVEPTRIQLRAVWCQN